MSELGELVREVALLKGDVMRLQDEWKAKDAELGRLREMLRTLVNAAEPWALSDTELAHAVNDGRHMLDAIHQQTPQPEKSK